MSALVWAVGQRSPSIAETISVDGVPFDLSASTVRFMAREPGSSDLVIDAAAVVVNAADGTVRYDWAAEDVAEARELLCWWEVTTSGKVQEVAEFLVEIREHAPASSRAICTRADVMRLVPGYADDQNTDGILEVLIEAESQAAHQRYGREFVGIDVGNREFDVDERSARTRTLTVGDMTSLTEVTVKTEDGAVVDVLAPEDVVCLPRIRQEWEPITELRMPTAPLAQGFVVEVEGTWGFPSIPADLRMAVAKLVLVRYLADSASSGTAFSDAINEQGFDAAIAFASAREVLRSYQTTRFA